MDRVSFGFRIAREAAAFVTHSRLRLGAAMLVGRRLVSIGWNTNRTHPASDTIFAWRHAEHNCLVGTHKVDCSRATIYVVRVSRSGRDRCSKPCPPCTKLLKAAGVRKVWYINRSGRRELMKLS